MTPAQSWQFGYRSCEVDPQYQLCLNYSTCALTDEYLVANCGGCNPGCDPSKAWITPAVHCLPSFLSDIGGLQFDRDGQATGISAFPDAVTLVWRNRATLPLDVAGPLAISPSLVFRVRTTSAGLRCTPNPDVRRSLGISDDARLWLAPGARDNTLEWMWENPDTVTDLLAANRFDLLISPDFSVYGNDCPLTWRVNGKRALVEYSEWLGLGIPCVPTVSIPNEFFATQWAEWIYRNPAVNCLAVNAQMWRDPVEFESMLDLLKCFSGMLDRELHFIVCGPVKPARIAMVKRALKSCTILSSAWYNRR